MTEGDANNSEVSGIINHNIKIASVTDNTSQHLVYTTEDKLELCINDYRKEIDKQYSVGTPFAAALTLWITIFTVEFKNVFSIQAPTVQALFWLAAGLSSLWLIYAIKKWYWRSGTSASDFIKLVKSRSLN